METSKPKIPRVKYYFSDRISLFGGTINPAPKIIPRFPNRDGGDVSKIEGWEPEVRRRQKSSVCALHASEGASDAALWG